MSSESEDNTLNRLLGLEKNQVSELAETPYQPTVYAIPKEQWEQMLSLLKSQTEFHETLLDVMRELPSKKRIEWFMNTTLREQNEMFSSQTNEVRESVRQAGSDREKFISQVSSLRQEQDREFRNALDKITKRIFRFTAATFLSSVLLSGLVSVLCLHWLS